MGKVEELTTLIETKHNEWKTLSINGLRDASGYKRWVAETVLKKYRSDTDQTKIKTLKQKSIPPQNTPQEHEFIDDPDELLMSVSIRMLNKEEPDPRWANVLITTRRENIGISKKEGIIQSKFKSMSIKEVSKILARKQESILLKPDLKESS